MDDRSVLGFVGKKQITQTISVGHVLDLLGQLARIAGRPFSGNADPPSPRLLAGFLDAL